MTVSDKYVERLRHRIFRKVVFEYCKENHEMTPTNPIFQLEKFDPITPYVAFSISNPSEHPSLRLASVQYCHVKSDHYFLDMSRTINRSRTMLMPYNLMRPHVSICRIRMGVLKAKFAMLLIVDVVNSPTCRNYSAIKPILNIGLVGVTSAYNESMDKMLAAVDEQFAVSLQTVCLKPSS